MYPQFLAQYRSCLLYTAEAECERIQQILDQKGPIDICILGIGMNGHIALNEPAPSLHTNCHVAHLSVSRFLRIPGDHGMLQGLDVYKRQRFTCTMP